MDAPSRDSGYPRYDARVLLNSQPVIVTVIDPATHQIQFQNETGVKKFGDLAGLALYRQVVEDLLDPALPLLEGGFERHYLALVHGVPARPSGTIEARISSGYRDGRRKLVDDEAPEGERRVEVRTVKLVEDVRHPRARDGDPPERALGQRRVDPGDDGRVGQRLCGRVGSDRAALRHGSDQGAPVLQHLGAHLSGDERQRVQLLGARWQLPARLHNFGPVPEVLNHDRGGRHDGEGHLGRRLD